MPDDLEEAMGSIASMDIESSTSPTPTSASTCCLAPTPVL